MIFRISSKNPKINFNVQSGFIPRGHINITSTNVVDVYEYATAQVVDVNLISNNILENVNILGIEGTAPSEQTMYGALLNQLWGG